MLQCDQFLTNEPYIRNKRALYPKQCDQCYNVTSYVESHTNIHTCFQEGNVGELLEHKDLGVV